MMIPWLRYWWRRLRYRCVVCGGPRPLQYMVGGQPIDGFDHLCTYCRKRSVHARNYSMGGHDAA